MQQAFQQASLAARIFPLNISQSGANVTENQNDGIIPVENDAS